METMDLRASASRQFDNLGMTRPGQHLGQNPVDPSSFGYGTMSARIPGSDW